MGSEELHSHLNSVESQLRDLDAHFADDQAARATPAPGAMANEAAMPLVAKLQADVTAVKGQLSAMQHQIERMADALLAAPRASPPAPRASPPARVPPEGKTMTYRRGRTSEQL